MASSPPRKGRHRLVRQLRATYESLASWDDSLRRAISHASASDGRVMSSEASALLVLLQNAKKVITLRLAELGVENLPATSNPPFAAKTEMAPADPTSDGEALSLKACQACGRALGDAFREAQAAADAASARVIYGSLREFEKQLWVLDPCQAA